MSLFRFIRLSLLATLLALGATPGLNRALAFQPTPGAEEGIEVLARGPAHEAFAETVTFDPQPGMIVAKTPPDAIEESPPEQRPEGDNVAWIPGYWAWDDDSGNFLWVSGIWRALPPGRQWVSGYWSKSGSGAQWTSGYWADAQLTEVEYLPEPPQSVEAGPNIAAPSADDIWLPGNWIWQQNRYAWRPGSWNAVQANWVWIPAHYSWSPRGYVFVDGYWDYAIARRGVLFATVIFSPNVYSQPGFSYTPSTVISLGVFASHLFLRPSYGHYYYGDYYGASYASAGFYPSYSYNAGRQGYDPIYAHQRWGHRQDSGWDRRAQADFQNRRDNENARPPRTFAAQQELGKKGLTGQDKGLLFAQPLAEHTQSKDSAVRFQSVSNEDRQRFGRLGQESRTYAQERQKLEANGAAERPALATEPSRGKLPPSPFVAKGELGNDRPPKTHELSKPDPSVVGKPRQPIGAGSTPKSVLSPTPRVDPSQPPKAGPNPTRPNPAPSPKVGPNPTQPPKAGPDPVQPPKVGPSPTRPNPTQPPKVGPNPTQPPKPNPTQPPKVGPNPAQPPKAAPNPTRPNPQPPKAGPNPQPPKNNAPNPAPGKGGPSGNPNGGPKKP